MIDFSIVVSGAAVLFSILALCRVTRTEKELEKFVVEVFNPYAKVINELCLETIIRDHIRSGGTEAGFMAKCQSREMMIRAARIFRRIRKAAQPPEIEPENRTVH